MKWHKNMLIKSYNSLDQNSELFNRNPNYFEDVFQQLNNINNKNTFSALNEYLSFISILKKSQRCISLVNKMLLFINDAKNTLLELEDSIYRQLLIDNFDDYHEKIINVISKPIISIAYLHDYLTIQKNDTFYPLQKKFDNYIKIEKEILDYIQYVEDDNTQLQRTVKQHYKNRFIDIHQMLTINNYEQVSNDFKKLSSKFAKEVAEEQVRIKRMLKETDLDIRSLNNILQNQNYDLHSELQTKVEQLRHEIIEIQTSIADSKYVLSKFYLAKNKTHKIKNECDLLILRSDLLEKNKNETINILKSFTKKFPQKNNLQVMINRLRILPNKLHSKEIDTSYKICEDSKKSVYNM